MKKPALLSLIRTSPLCDSTVYFGNRPAGNYLPAGLFLFR